MVTRALSLQAEIKEFISKTLKKHSWVPIENAQNTVIKLPPGEGHRALEIEPQITQLGVDIIYRINPVDEQLYRSLVLLRARIVILGSELRAKYRAAELFQVKRDVSCIIDFLNSSETSEESFTPRSDTPSPLCDEGNEADATCWNGICEA